MNRADIWMPLYIGDYLADTARLTTEQHGAYLLLIMDYWRNGPPPDDDEILQSITRFSKFLWKKQRPLLEKYFQVKDGVWRHKRIDEEMAEALSSKEMATDKARKAAEARWSKSDARSIPQALLEECPSPSPSPTPLKAESKAKAAPQFDALGYLESMDVEKQVASDWLDLRKMKKAKPSKTAFDGVATEAKKAGISMDAAVRTCCKRNWVGFEAHWIDKGSGGSGSGQLNFHDDRKRVMDELTGRNRHAAIDNANIIDI